MDKEKLNSLIRKNARAAIASSKPMPKYRSKATSPEDDEESGKYYGQEDTSNLTASEVANNALNARDNIKKVKDEFDKVKKVKQYNFNADADSRQLFDPSTYKSNADINTTAGKNGLSRDAGTNNISKVDKTLARQNRAAQTLESAANKEARLNHIKGLSEIPVPKKKRFNLFKKKPKKLPFKIGKKATKKKAASITTKFAKSIVGKSASSGAVAGAASVGSVVLVVILIMLIITLILIIILYFTNNYIREASIESDAKRLDTRLGKVIYAFKEESELQDLYDNLIEGSSGDKQKDYISNMRNLIHTDEVEEVLASEDYKSGFLLQDPDNWAMLSMERNTYAYGGYLEWKPDSYTTSVNYYSGASSNISGGVEGIEAWKPLCSEIGEKYGIDPNILLTIINIESSGNPSVGNANYKGLCAMGADNFAAYFANDPVYKSYTAADRIPRCGRKNCNGCSYYDEEHQRVGRFQIEYLARRLTAQMGYFMQKEYELDYRVDNIPEDVMQNAIYYTITGYQTGEYGQLAIYHNYKNDSQLYGGDGSYYTSVFLKHFKGDSKFQRGSALQSPYIRSGYYTVGSSNRTYLEKAYRFYGQIAKSDLSQAGSNYEYDSAKWWKHSAFKDSNISSNNNNSGNTGNSDSNNLVTGKTPGSIEDKDLHFKGDGDEKELVNEIMSRNEKERIEYDVRQYNRWMKMIDDYYLRNYPEKFLDGGSSAELYAATPEGAEDRSQIIKHKSYIHNAVDNTKVSTETSSFGSFEEVISYVLGVKHFANLNETKDIGEKLSTEEKDAAINRYELNFEVLKAINAKNNIIDDDKAREILVKAISYAVPIYEYVTINKEEANKTFFENEMYSSSSYDSKGILKIDNNKFNKVLDDIIDIDIRYTEFIEDGYSEENAKKIEKRTEDAFKYMYLSKNKAVDSKNHLLEVPSDISKYYIQINGETCDRMNEIVTATALYDSGTEAYSNSEDYQIGAWMEATEAEAAGTSLVDVSADLRREYVTATLKPKHTTTLKYDFNYEYITREFGERKLDEKNQTVICQKAPVYAIDEDGNRTYHTTVYRKKIIRAYNYSIGKYRERNITER